MNAHAHEKQGSGARTSVMDRWRRAAWLVIVIADVGLLLWGAGAALIPTLLPGPGSTAILPAGYEGYTSWGAENYTPKNVLDHLQREAFYGIVATQSGEALASSARHTSIPSPDRAKTRTRSGAPGYVETRNGIAAAGRAVAPALRPPDERKEPEASLP